MINIFGSTVDASSLSGLLSSVLGIFYRLRIGMKMSVLEWIMSVFILFIMGGMVYVATGDSFTDNQEGLRAFFSGCAAFTLSEILAVAVDTVKKLIPNTIKSILAKLGIKEL